MILLSNYQCATTPIEYAASRQRINRNAHAIGFPINLKISQATNAAETPKTSSEISETESTDGLNSERQESDEKPTYKYIGNSFSFKFHRPSCPFAKAMWRKHVLHFQFRQQAIDAGQKPCRYCLPPYWKSVDAKLVDPKIRHFPDNNHLDANARVPAGEDPEQPSPKQNVNGTTFSDTESKKPNVK